MTRRYTPPMDRIWIGLGALAGLTGVAMSAYASHGALSGASVQMLRDAVQIQGWHALALLFTGLWATRGGRLAHLAGATFTIGLLLFCGSIYALALGKLPRAALAPAGGMTLMAGWALLGLSALRARR